MDPASLKLVRIELGRKAVVEKNKNGESSKYQVYVYLIGAICEILGD